MDYQEFVGLHASRASTMRAFVIALQDGVPRLFEREDGKASPATRASLTRTARRLARELNDNRYNYLLSTENEEGIWACILLPADREPAVKRRRPLTGGAA